MDMNNLKTMSRCPKCGKLTTEDYCCGFNLDLFGERVLVDARGKIVNPADLQSLNNNTGTGTVGNINSTVNNNTAEKSQHVPNTPAPVRKMVTLFEYYKKCIRRYGVFDGRAGRAEFWGFYLYNVIFGFAVGVVSGLLSLIFAYAVFISVLYGLAIIVPTIAVSVRRLHDTNKSGWMYLLSLIPFVGFVIYIVLMCMQGTDGDNKYGPQPTRYRTPSFDPRDNEHTTLYNPPPPYYKLISRRNK